MKLLIALVFVSCLSSLAIGQAKNDVSSDLIVAGVGWGPVVVNADRVTVEKRLGKGQGEEGSQYLDGVYFREYPDFGIEVSYTHKGNKVVAIFFYNHQHRYEYMTTAPFKTDKGVGWQASYRDVKKAYGKPIEDNHGDQGDNWRRVVFEGIDFRFENDVMVRIGIPGK